MAYAELGVIVRLARTQHLWACKAAGLCEPVGLGRAGDRVEAELQSDGARDAELAAAQAAAVAAVGALAQPRRQAAGGRLLPCRCLC